MPLDAQQRVRMARIIKADLDLRRLSADDQVRELLRVLLLPAAAQRDEFLAALGRVRAFVEAQQAEAPNVRAAQDASWETDLTTVGDLERSV